MSPDLSATIDAVEALAATERLLVISDFDGTLAEFNVDPMNVPVQRDSMAAIRELAELPRTEAVILSGRSLNNLRQLTNMTAPVRLVGSHGAEPEGERIEVSPAQRAALTGLDEALGAIVRDYPGSWVESKPVQRVAHYRELADPTDFLRRVRAVAVPGASQSEGKSMVEFSVSPATKGTWIAAHRSRTAPTAVLFLGDDTTDETGFRVLGPGDVGVKVGTGDTAATHRVADVDEVAEVLTALVRSRGRATSTGAPER